MFARILDVLLDGHVIHGKPVRQDKQDRFHCQGIKKKLFNLSSFSEEPPAVFLQLLS